MPATERVLPPINETGFKGLNANPDMPAPLGFVSLAQNFYMKGNRWVPRPGLLLSDEQISSDNVQCLAHFEELDGTAWTVAIVGGDLYSYTWSTDTWALEEDLSAASISQSTTAVTDFAISRGRIIFTDGVNDPWMWDPSTDTFTQLTEAPVSTQVTQYYDKSFFWSGLTLEWSDEGDPTDGYANDLQAWDFAQQDGGPLVSLVGLNEALLVFKQDSIASVRGAVEDTFQTDAVREGISETEGTPGYGNVQVVDGDVYYLSPQGPRVIVGGARRVPLDMDEQGNDILEDVWSTFARDELANAISFYDKERKLVVWLMAKSGETVKYSGIAYSTENGAFSTIEFSSGFNFLSAARVEDPDGNDYVMLGDDDGQIYIWGDPSQTQSDDGTAFTLRLRSRQYGQSLGVVQKRICQTDLVLDVTAVPFRGLMRPYLNNQGSEQFELMEKSFGYETTGRKRYTRGFNQVGWTVGWDLEVLSTEGLCEVHAALTQLTTTGKHPSRG